MMSSQTQGPAPAGDPATLYPWFGSNNQQHVFYVDMMGNLQEWTSAPAGTLRGGYYGDTTLNGNGCLYATTAHDTTYWDYSTGFRCCM